MKALYLNIGKLVLLVILGFGFHGQAHALSNCAATSGLPGPILYAPTIKVASNLQPGDTIPNTYKSFSVSGQCVLGKGTPLTIQVGSSIVMCSLNGGSTEVQPGVYTTAVTGIGIRVRDGSGNLLTNAGGQACQSSIATVQPGGYYSFSGSLELVRLSGTIPNNGQISGGPTGTGAFAFGVYNTNVVLNNDAGNINTGSNSIYPTGSITFQNIACNVDYPTTVNLPTVSVASMQTSVTAGDTPFTIGVTCDQPAGASISFTAPSGIAVVNASNGVIGIQSGSGMASGVGIQLLNSATNAQPLETFTTLGSLSANLRSPFKFYGRYYRTGTATPGNVQSAVVFTMSYQ